MNTTPNEPQPGIEAAASTPKPKPSRKVRPRKQSTATPKRRPGATAVTKRAKGGPAPGHSRQGTKTAKVLAMLRRPGGATNQQLQKATGWLPHSVRGFLSGTVTKKMGLAVDSAKSADGERTYSLPH